MGAGVRCAVRSLSVQR